MTVPSVLQGLRSSQRLTRRVVITGIGLVTPLGCGNEDVWKSLISSQHGISTLDSPLIVKGTGVSIAGIVPRSNNVSNEQGHYNEELVFGRSVSKELAGFCQYAVYASDLALAHAGLIPETMSPMALDRAGVAVASGGIGSLQDIVESSKLLDVSYKKVSPYFVPKILSNMAAGHVSIRHKFRGPVTSVSTACAAGTHSIGDSFNYIRMGYADVMLAGGTESSINPLSISGFARMKALSESSVPGTASRPFDSARNGFVMSEGAGIVVLEELSVAQSRGANIIAEIIGFGLSGDAHHPTHPSAEGSGAERSMRNALDDAGIKPDDIGYINAHATSTPIGDAIEVLAIEKVFNSRNESVSGPLLVSSTKGATGHLLGAAGAVETAFTALALRDGIIPSTLNLEKPDSTSTIFHHVPHKSVKYDEHISHKNDMKEKKLVYALKNSFGFGGMNASLVLAKFES
mmetsp:Transcript_8758/g.8669  ORF Transcript_8758/g.8669 Transcript_8758/m.8669 type:complete len:460 (+) Transcript_8758:236-1615(+)